MVQLNNLTSTEGPPTTLGVAPQEVQPVQITQTPALDPEAQKKLQGLIKQTNEKEFTSGVTKADVQLIVTTIVNEQVKPLFDKLNDAIGDIYTSLVELESIIGSKVAPALGPDGQPLPYTGKKRGRKAKVASSTEQPKNAREMGLDPTVYIVNALNQRGGTLSIKGMLEEMIREGFITKDGESDAEVTTAFTQFLVDSGLTVAGDEFSIAGGGE
jgi:hypothetical protein